MHPEGATTPAWETALWPERRMPPQTIANRLSEARRALGFSPDGRPRLRKSGERHLIADVRTDWERFKTLACRGATPRRGAHALELVRGRPFLDLHQGQWTALEGFAVEIEHAVVECALRLGGLCLDAGRPDDAIWAAQRALRATPWDERLHRLLMEAADAAGDRAGVEATLRHLALVLEIDGDPLRGVHPETAALYARLSGRPPAMSRSADQGFPSRREALGHGNRRATLAVLGVVFSGRLASTTRGHGWRPRQCHAFRCTEIASCRHRFSITRNPQGESGATCSQVPSSDVRGMGEARRVRRPRRALCYRMLAGTASASSVAAKKPKPKPPSSSSLKTIAQLAEGQRERDLQRHLHVTTPSVKGPLSFAYAQKSPDFRSIFKEAAGFGHLREARIEGLRLRSDGGRVLLCRGDELDCELGGPRLFRAESGAPGDRGHGIGATGS